MNRFLRVITNQVKDENVLAVLCVLLILMALFVAHILVSAYVARQFVALGFVYFITPFAICLWRIYKEHKDDDA